MPIYEYRCSDCEHEFEELVRTERGASDVSCPSCRGRSVLRRLSVFAAREGTVGSAAMPGPGACGRCGDPDGPCSM